MTEQSAWRPGIEISTWPDLKFARAIDHLNRLTAQINTWSASAPVTTDKNISDDGLTATVVLRLRPEPPLKEWGLTLGDVVHNLRSALDALVWELTHLDGATPVNPRQVQFPVATTAESWARSAGALSSMPPEALERVRQLQPYQFPDAHGANALELLVNVSNLDKHRSPIEATIVGSEIAFRNLGLKFESDEAADAAGKPHIEVAFGEFKDDTTIVRITSPVPILEIKAPMAIRPEIQLAVDGNRTRLDQSLNAMMQQVRGVLDYIYIGPAPEPGPADDEGWHPVDIVEKDSLD